MKDPSKTPPYQCHLCGDFCCNTDKDCPKSYCLNDPTKVPPYFCHPAAAAPAKKVVTTVAPPKKTCCSVNFLEVDTITVLAEVVPCQAPAHADLTISDSELGISHQFAGISAGEAYNLPVPGLSLDVPLVGEVGVVMDIELDGDLSSFEIDLA